MLVKCSKSSSIGTGLAQNTIGIEKDKGSNTKAKTCKKIYSHHANYITKAKAFLSLRRQPFNSNNLSSIML